MDSVLLVDDDPVFLRIIKSAFEAGGYCVKTVLGTAEAMDIVKEDEPTVVVTAFEMRDNTGEAFIRWLAENAPQTECIVLAYPSSVSQLVHLYDLNNIFNHKWKPLEEIGDLARDVARAMERRALKQQNSYLLTELRDARDELRNQTEFLIQVERLAALGHIAAFSAQGIDEKLNDVDDALITMRDILDESKPVTQVRERLNACVRAIGDAEKECKSDVRAIVRVSHKEQIASPMVVDISKTLDKTIHLLRTMLRDSNVTCLRTSTAPDSESLSIAGDEALIHQALLHVLLNGIQAMPDGGCLFVGVEEIPGAEPGARITIRDTGEGIAPEMLASIFQPFFTTKPLGQGTGLGLSVTRAIIRSHDGSVDVQSALGSGTTVTITLPAVLKQKDTWDPGIGRVLSAA